MKKRSVILKITRLSPKKTFAKLIDSCIELDSIRKLLLKFFYTNYHILITHIFFLNMSFPLKSCEFCKSCEMQSRDKELSHSEVIFTQFTSSLFLTLCILIGIKNSLPLHSSLNSCFEASKSSLYLSSNVLGKISIGLGYLTTAKSAYIVHLRVKFTGTFLTIPSDSVGVVAMPLRSCFSFVSIFSFDHLDISSDIIGKLAPGSTVPARITKHLILHLTVTTSVVGSFFQIKFISMGP